MLTTGEKVNLILGVLTFLGVIYTVWTTRSISKKSHLNEYYKKVIERQFLAYQTLDEILRKLNIKNILPSGKLYHKFFSTPEEMNEFFSEFNNMAVSNYLFSNSLTVLIHDFNKFLLQIKNESFSSKNNCSSIGAKNHDDINIYFVKLQKCYIDDLKNLHNVSSFLAKRSKDLEKIIIDMENRKNLIN